jgi:hypothetical protein
MKYLKKMIGLAVKEITKRIEIEVQQAPDVKSLEKIVSSLRETLAQIVKNRKSLGDPNSKPA